MNLEELKNLVDANYERIPNGYSPKDISVLITTAEPSIGGRASSGISGIFMGFDWESNQLRIEPTDKLVRLGNSLSDVKPCVHKVYDGADTYCCPRCTGMVQERDKFCKHCGQKMK